MPAGPSIAPENTAARVALWRALHLEVDAPPHVIEDTIGLRLVAPEEGWRDRMDMHPFGTRTFRASIVSRARFVEDLVAERLARGVAQYVILGAGIDTFAERRVDLASRMNVFEVDQPGPQEWKRRRLVELGYGVPSFLHLVPVDFESGASWWDALLAAKFDPKAPAVVAALGVSMYLTHEAIAAMMKPITALPSGSAFAMTFMQPHHRLDPSERPAMEAAERGARAAGTPFLSTFVPDEIVAFARACGFRDVKHVSGEDYAARYFANRTDGLKPSNGEEMIVAST